MRVFGLGYFDLNDLSPFYDRLMFPIRDQYGELLSFQGRALYDFHIARKPKYYHSPFDKGGVVYGLYEGAEAAIEAACVVLVEGPMDVIALYDAGLPAVALLGSTFSSYQAYVLRRYTRNVLIWLDQDEAGKRATKNVLALLRTMDFNAREVAPFRAFKDASETWQKAGHEGVRRMIHG